MCQIVCDRRIFQFIIQEGYWLHKITYNRGAIWKCWSNLFCVGSSLPRLLPIPCKSTKIQLLDSVQLLSLQSTLVLCNEQLTSKPHCAKLSQCIRRNLPSQTQMPYKPWPYKPQLMHTSLNRKHIDTTPPCNIKYCCPV